MSLRLNKATLVSWILRIWQILNPDKVSIDTPTGRFSSLCPTLKKLFLLFSATTIINTSSMRSAFFLLKNARSN